MSIIKLRNNKTAKDVRLGRLIQFDKTSRKFPIMALVASKKPRSYTWRCGTWLNQGFEGSCVGHGIAHELLSAPAPADPAKVDHTYAKEVIYWGAQKSDGWPGGSYPGARPQYEGTSVLSGVKVAQKLKWFDDYRWGFGLEDLVLGVGHNGPAVMGLVWLAGMGNTDEKGFIHATGSTQGGHCLLCRGVNVPEKYFLLRNSWGQDWGMGGDCKISFDDMEKLLHMNGEACFFLRRKGKI